MSNNKHNLLYFEASSMKELFNMMESWQHEHSKRLLSTNIEKDNDKFCCIALSNPTEVVIVHGEDPSQASVTQGRLLTEAKPNSEALWALDERLK